MTTPEEASSDSVLESSLSTNTLSETQVNSKSSPQPTIDEVLQCQFSKWYATFRNVPDYHRTNVTIKSVILPLPPNFVDYLLSDGVRLPNGATNVSSCVPPESQNDDDAWSLSNDGDNDKGSSHDEGALQEFSFPELNDEISCAISSLGGSVVPKLNWSSPKDATWMNHGTLKCQTPGDVYLLLKSSDFVLHDVLHAFDNVSNGNEQHGDRNKKHSKVSYELALRKWCNLHPSMEFRCFVNQHELVAISQRNHTQHFAHLMGDRLEIQLHIEEFFEQVVCRRFSQGKVENYCFDVYVDKKNRIWLLDFNVWGVQTDALLFEWNELTVMTAQQDYVYQISPEFRVVETELGIQQDPLASYRAPIDTINLASMTGGDVTNFEEFMAMCKPPSEIKS